jgi:hypothetical protein
MLVRKRGKRRMIGKWEINSLEKPDRKSGGWGKCQVDQK